MEMYIKIAADSVAVLRKQDVFRVLQQNSKNITKKLATYISEQRPDLADEVRECIEDL